MRIALIGTEAHAIDQAREILRRAGHTVVNCYDEHPRGTGPVDPDQHIGCPGPPRVDVIVAVRAHPVDRVTNQEQHLLVCPMLAGAPLVVAGSPMPNPFGDRADSLVFGLDGIEAACAEVIRPPTRVLLSPPATTRSEP